VSSDNDEVLVVMLGRMQGDYSDQSCRYAAGEVGQGQAILS